MQPIDRKKAQLHRRYLEDLRWILTREYWKQREASRLETAGPEDLVELPVRAYSRDYLMSLGPHEREQLFQIEEALARIDRGDYASCGHCGQPIEENRLDAAPWTRHCATCEGMQKTRRATVWKGFALESAG